MARLLEKIKLKEHFEYSFEIDKIVFLENLYKIVDIGNTSDLFSNKFDRFVDGDNYYIGSISEDNFEIRKRYAFFNNNSSLAIGKINSSNGTVSVFTEITAFNHSNTYGPLVFFLLYIGFSFIIYSEFENEFSTYFRNLSSIFVLIIVVLFYFMKKSVSDLRFELESDFDLIKAQNKSSH
jgi:hypothetical protein